MADEIYLGLMSGTSLDAVDVVAINFRSRLQLLATHSEPMPHELRQQVLALTQPSAEEIDRMGAVDVELGLLFAQAANTLLAQAGIEKRQVKALGSHGQTIRHRPYASPAFTLQIADPNTIAEATGLTVVADFRRRDVAAGGQGAPLVPAFHEAILRHKHHNRIVLNLGGMANITVLPADTQQPVYGFDTGPANVLMDAWIQRVLAQPFDVDGDWAASGEVIVPLLHQLLSHPFFKRQPPKSTGREDFHLAWLEAELASYDNRAAADVQATLLELTAQSIADAVIQTRLLNGELWLCGGGAYNQRLWRRLQSLLPHFSLHNTAEIGLAPTWVEASAFAWLARQTMNGLTGNIPAVTGAKGPRILGGIYPA